MTQFFLSAKTQYQNLGDAIITRELLRLAASNGNVHLNLAGMPASFLETIESSKYQQYNNTVSFVAAIFWCALRHIFAPSKSKVYYLLNPGGFEGDLRPADLLRNLVLILIYSILTIFGVRLMRVGCSLGPFSATRLTLEKIKARFIYKPSARDSISIQYANSNGLGYCTYFADLALLLSPPTQFTTAKSPYVVISFRAGSKFYGYDDLIERRLREILLQPQLHSVARIFASQVSFDVPRSQQLHNALKDMPGESNQSKIATFEEYCLLYQGATVVFSNRLHVLLFALRQGAIAYALIDPSVNQKIVGIFQQLALSRFVLDIRKEITSLPLPDAAEHASEVSQIFITQSSLARIEFAERVGK